MVVVEGFDLCQIAFCVLLIAHTIVTEGEHVLAVDEVFRIKRVLPDEQIGQ